MHGHLCSTSKHFAFWHYWFAFSGTVSMLHDIIDLHSAEHFQCVIPEWYICLTSSSFLVAARRRKVISYTFIIGRTEKAPASLRMMFSVMNWEFYSCMVNERCMDFTMLEKEVCDEILYSASHNWSFVNPFNDSLWCPLAVEVFTKCLQLALTGEAP